MAGAGDDVHRAAQLHKGLGRAAEGAGGVHHIVEEDDLLAPDVADDVHDLGGVGLLAALVHNGQAHAQLLGEGAGAGHAAHVGGDDDHLVLPAVKAVVEIVGENGVAQQIVHGDVKEALNLVGVEIHGEDPVGAGAGDQVGHQLGGDGVAGLGLAVLAGVAEVGHHGGDAAGGGPLEGIDHDEQLHEVVVDRGAGGLDHEHVGAADGLIDGDKVLPIREGAHLGVAQLRAHLLADGLGQGAVGSAGKDLDVLTVCDHSCNILSHFFSILYPAAAGKSYFLRLRRLAAHCFLTVWRVRAMARESAGTSSVMVLPPAVYAPSPTRTGATRLVLQPMNAWSPMTVRNLLVPS